MKIHLLHFCFRGGNKSEYKLIDSDGRRDRDWLNTTNRMAVRPFPTQPRGYCRIPDMAFANLPGGQFGEGVRVHCVYFQIERARSFQNTFCFAYRESECSPALLAGVTAEDWYEQCRYLTESQDSIELPQRSSPVDTPQVFHGALQPRSYYLYEFPDSKGKLYSGQFTAEQWEDIIGGKTPVVTNQPTGSPQSSPSAPSRGCPRSSDGTPRTPKLSTQPKVPDSPSFVSKKDSPETCAPSQESKPQHRPRPPEPSPIPPIIRCIIIAIPLLLFVWGINQLIPCSRCKGDGTIRVEEICQFCNGDRYDLVDVDCKRCEGKGYEWHEENCASCKGSGSVVQRGPCSACNGEGSVENETVCPSCNGKRQVRTNKKCLFCEGKGKVTCRSCEGKRKCATCRGTGKVPGWETFNLRDMCKTHGRIEGLFRNIFFSDCSDCHGTKWCRQCRGYAMEVCPECSGSGKRMEQCFKCKGKGCLSTRKKCPSCKGKKIVSNSVQCEDCKGSGVQKRKISCERCNGKGQVPQKSVCPKCRGEGTRVVRIPCPSCGGK